MRKARVNIAMFVLLNKTNCRCVQGRLYGAKISQVKIENYLAGTKTYTAFRKQWHQFKLPVRTEALTQPASLASIDCYFLMLKIKEYIANGK